MKSILSGFFCCLTLLAVWSGGGSSYAAMIVSHAADFEPRLQTSTGSFAPGNSTTADRLRIGFQTNFRMMGVYFFRLPALPIGETIISADFSVSGLPDAATTAAIPNHNADLVALGITNVNPPGNGETESLAYYHLGEGAADLGPGEMLIQNNFLVPADFIPSTGTIALKSTNAAGDLALLTYINGLYANRAINGFIQNTSYLILRVNPDLTSDTGTRRYSLASAEVARPGAQAPTLTLTTFVIPEPGTMVLAASGLLMLIFRRCARNR